GPLLDRIDMHLEVPPLDYTHLTDKKDYESSKTIRERVSKARDLQRRRYNSENKSNSNLNPKEIKKYCNLTDEANNILKSAIIELNLSGRAYDKVLKLALTISDLTGKDMIDVASVSEAIGYRSLDRSIWL
ncbi:MAG: ATP-binding protein, partial [Candidatus Omnitrophica bacterium]|nr:ATP-binding protein [Candidatus Omnitrophota bacterium]